MSDKPKIDTKNLEPIACDILCNEATERPFSSQLYTEHRKGTYVCAGCGAPLFSSDVKYNSGTGWPSFFQSNEGAFEFKSDHKIGVTRTEYHCANCGGHHGHLFDDGPAPTGKRFCNNGHALKFIPDEDQSH